MDKQTFLAADAPAGADTWWLLQQEVSADVEERRKQLGAALGWDYPTWYTEPDKVAALYEWIEARAATALTELDDLTDPAQQAGWLESILGKAAPAEAEAPAGPSAEGAAGASGRAGADAAGTAARETEAAPAAPVKKSIFAKKTAAPAAETAPAPAAGVATDSAAESGEEAAAPAAARKSSLFARKAAPQEAAEPAAAGTAGAGAAPAGPGAAPAEAGTAASAETGAATAGAPSETAEAEAGAAAGAPAGTAEAAETFTVEAVAEAMSQLSDEDLSGLAGELEMSEEELNELLKDPAFEAMVAEEAAKLS